MSAASSAGWRSFRTRSCALPAPEMARGSSEGRSGEDSFAEGDTFVFGRLDGGGDTVVVMRKELLKEERLLKERARGVHGKTRVAESSTNMVKEIEHLQRSLT